MFEMQVEEDLPCKTPEEGQVDELVYFEGEGCGDVVGGAGTAEEVELVDPVVGA